MGTEGVEDGDDDEEEEVEDGEEGEEWVDALVAPSTSGAPLPLSHGGGELSWALPRLSSPICHREGRVCNKALDEMDIKR